ncbi:MAG: type II toxin-antitoxin system PemK/MazF family toxin, partial [Spirochaetaceae bacterium]
MNRGEVYLVKKPSIADPKRRRAFVIVSRQILIDSKFSTLICAPIYSAIAGLDTQVVVGPREGLKHESAVHCDNLVSLPKSMLTDFVGSLGEAKMRSLDLALACALDIDT